MQALARLSKALNRRQVAAKRADRRAAAAWQAWRDARADLDRAMAAARGSGVPLVRIAEKVGVTVNGARNMVRRGSGA